ncbi:MAG: transcription antitermination factor NusB [Deltaproteobacteria bacterium]|nr:transcription antitermination factor NusB [Deltaproteobacteria bacterium]
MPGRRRAREFSLQALFQADLTETDPRAALADLWALLLDDDTARAPAPVREETAFASEVVAGVQDRGAEIDALIEAASLNWRLVRMPVVDRNILRLACWELVVRTDIPVSVTINEAVELAKRYGGPDSRAFVNGILDRIAHDIGRGGRGPRKPPPST